MTGPGISGDGLFSSGGGALCSVVVAFGFLAASVRVCFLGATVLVGTEVGVAGCALATGSSTGLTNSELSLFCVFFFNLAGVAARSGVAGTTGTAGVMLEDVVRDMGREDGRERESSFTARGTTGAVNPGGIVGVDRRGGSRRCVPKGVLGVPITFSMSLSLTSRSTFSDASSSAVNDVSSAYSR